MVTIGHNPFQPNLGMAHHIVLHAEGGDGDTPEDPGSFANGCNRRRKFVDEYIYDRLFMSAKPFPVPILRNLRKVMLDNTTVRKADRIVTGKFQESLSKSLHAKSMHSRSLHGASVHGRSNKMSTHMMISVHAKKHNIYAAKLPFGSHHIDPGVLINSDSIDTSVFADFVMQYRELLKPKLMKAGKADAIIKSSNDPAVRTAFSSKLDTQTKQIQDLQVIVQQFYECRIASLER